MEQQDYRTEITVALPAVAAFESITDVSAWWAKETEGPTKKLNDVFTVRFGETSATLKIAEWIPVKKLTWLIQDCYLNC